MCVHHCCRTHRALSDRIMYDALPGILIVILRRLACFRSVLVAMRVGSVRATICEAYNTTHTGSTEKCVFGLCDLHTRHALKDNVI